MGLFGRKDKDKKKAETKTDAWIYAKVIVKNPEKIDDYQPHYLILADTSMIVKGHCFSNMSKALNILAEKGWRLVTYEIAGVSNILIGHAILERKE